MKKILMIFQLSFVFVYLFLFGSPSQSVVANTHQFFTISQPQIRAESCSFNAAMPGKGYRIVQRPAPVTPRQQQLFNWFSPWAIQRNPILANMWFTILTLEGENNARAGAFGIAINPQWFAELGEDISIGIYAHELGHVSQAYGLIPRNDELVRRFGLEGQADYFAGTLLKSSRQFTPEQMRRMADFIRPSPGDATHARGRVRADLMMQGYNDIP
jgi:hypothetical protein